MGYNNDDLRHAGIKGMRWGVRRFQNRDGTLTPAGKKRYESDLRKLRFEQQVLKNKQATQAKLDKLKSMRNEIDEGTRSLAPTKSVDSKPASNNAPTVKRTVKQMPDDELKSIVERLKLEQKYRELNPQKVSFGKQFTRDMIDKSVVPAVQDVSKNLIKNLLEKAIKEAASKDK